MAKSLSPKGKQKLRGKDLKKLLNNQASSLALNLLAKHYKYESKVNKLKLLQAIVATPENFIDHEIWSVFAKELIEIPEPASPAEQRVSKTAAPFSVYGRKLIDSNAYQQMHSAMKLPVAVKGALMPDAHHGYGLPIGGVLATKNEVIPYAVGLDIGCRMALSIYEVPASYLKKNSFKLKQALKERTAFGKSTVDIRQEHAILDRKEFGETTFLRKLHGTAAKQLGSSGSGNHFVEWGEVELNEGNELGMDAGTYLGLLSHSGSRGFGAQIAQHFTELAKTKCRLPRQVQQLAWLDLDTEAGAEYWLCMNLAGDYAKACHDRIHINLSKYMGLKKVVTIENHHNFAWKEKDADGQELIVHRKGATPASKGALGIIPGSMVAPGYIVRGLGADAALNSAAHGAGRKLSRKKAKDSYTNSELKKVLKREGVSLIGGGVDEAPIAYKTIEEVMRYSGDLVECIGKFWPKIVRMNG